MPIGEICNRDVVIVRRKDSILDAAKLMRQYHVRGLVVVEDRDGEVAPVGIVTDRDLVVELIAKEVPLDSVFVEDVMSPELFSVSESRGIWDTIQYMRGRGIRRVVVVNERETLLGILSIEDLLELLADELSDLARLFVRERDREKETRE
ncbi:MAG: inosine 5'-monophosphate dehydrogenase [Syntrophus sp. PtaU1.Bin005]|jgi:predicted transcriptional regulator|uniref:CBS domain-containing protein n=1 Tax=Syntrophus TaxID=43773 RepID=UPI0009C47235|nr:MAG: inosine 5'-monophosphate dehydrogenase [Syntrophus sp. PtaB.Bin138]OPY81493.1 MAG: inosine 5'-monophosphate dehydrogenase [Syntrophus sp. PtaU1.Bin005]